MSWLDAFFAGYNTVQDEGLPVVQRAITNYVGATVADDPVTKTTTVTIPTAAASTQISAKVVSTSDITLSGTQVIDGVSVGVGDRVLVAGQTAGAENGLRTVALGVWPRTADAIVSGMPVFVQSGDVNKGRTYVLVTPAPIAVDTTPLSFVPQQSVIDFDQFGGVGDGDLAGNGTDNSPILAAALLALAPGGTLYFGPFIYALASTTTLAQSNVTLRGHLGATVLIAALGSDYLWIIERTVQGSELRFEDIIFDANGANRGGNTNSLGCIRIVKQDDWHFEGITVRNTLAASGGEAVGAQILGSRGSHNGCKSSACGAFGLPSDGFFAAGGEIHATNYIAELVTDTGHVFQNCSNSSLVGFSMLDCQAGFAIGPGIQGADGGDQVGMTVAHGKIGCTIGANARGARPITGASTATPVQVLSPTHGLVTNDRVYISGVDGMPEINGMWVVTRIDANNYTIADIASNPVVGVGTYVSGGYGQPTFQAQGFDLGTYGTGIALADELNGVTISDLEIDNRTNIGTPAMSFWAANALAAPPSTAITGATNVSPIVVHAVNHGYIPGQIVCNYGVVGNQAANGRFKVGAVADADHFALLDLDGNPVAGTGAYASGGHTQATARTRNVKLHDIRLTTENIFSFAAVFNNVENLEVENCDFIGDANPCVDVIGNCTELRFKENLIEPSGPQGVGISGGCYRLQFDRNTIRGKDGSTNYGLVFADTSAEVYVQDNVITGSSLSTSNGLFTSATLINTDNQAWYGGKAGFGQAPGNAEVSITSPGSNKLAVSMVSGGADTGAGFGANGEFGGMVHAAGSVLSGVVRFGASVRGELGLTSGNGPNWTWVDAAFYRLNGGGFGAFGVGANGDPSAHRAWFVMTAGSANDAPMHFIPGTAKTSPADGDIDFTTTNMLATIGGTRYDLVRAFGTTTTAINISATALTVGQVATNTGTVTGARAGDFVLVAPSTGTPSDNGTLVDAYVSANDTVTVRVTCVTASITTTSTTYNVRVIKKP